jgi:IclR helix-turn-helix domain./Nucleotidyltransferase domain.
MTRMADLTAEVMLALAERSEGRTLSDIARSLRRTPSSAQRALSRMVRDGVVLVEPGVHPRYRLNEQAPVDALLRIARWSLPPERLASVKTRTRGSAARREAARLIERVAPKSEASRWVPGAVERVVDGFDPVRIVLFGSQSRGGARWDSDFDFLVVMRHVEQPRELAIQIRRALRDLPVAKDVMVVSQDAAHAWVAVPGTALHEALTEGTTVYER